jgi:hypothetical protein
LKTEEELWNERERCSTRDRKEAILDSVLVHHHKDMFSDLVSRVDSLECKLQFRDFKLLSDRFSAPTFNLLGIAMHRILVLWDHAIDAVRVGTMLIGVQRSRQIRLQPQAQIRTSTAMPTTVHLLRQGRIKLMLV